MIRRLVFLTVLCLIASLLATDTVSACFRKGSSSCCTSCCCPCIPCHGCYCRAVNPSTKPGEPRSVLVWCTCCPHHTPHWSCCYVYRFQRWLWVHVYYCYPHGTTPKMEDSEHDAPPSDKLGEELTPLESSATLVVTLPQEATLTIDGRATASTSSTRVFTTPPLDAGKMYQYTLEAKLVRDGKIVSVTREVAISAGQETRVSLDMPVETLASN